MSEAKRKDSNTEEIKAAIIECDWLCIDTHSFGKGFPDCIAVKKLCGEVYATVFIEIKTEHGYFTKAQKQFYDLYPGLVHVVKNADETKDLLKKYDMDILLAVLSNTRKTKKAK